MFRETRPLRAGTKEVELRTLPQKARWFKQEPERKENRGESKM